MKKHFKTPVENRSPFVFTSQSWSRCLQDFAFFGVVHRKFNSRI